MRSANARRRASAAFNSALTSSPAAVSDAGGSGSALDVTSTAVANIWQHTTSFFGRPCCRCALFVKAHFELMLLIEAVVGAVGTASGVLQPTNDAWHALLTATLNARFAAGVPSDRLEEAGVLLRHDGAVPRALCTRGAPTRRRRPT